MAISKINYNKKMTNEHQPYFHSNYLNLSKIIFLYGVLGFWGFGVLGEV